MESHDGNNKAGQQRQVPSFFKEGSLSQGNGIPENSAVPAQNGKDDILSKPSTKGLLNQQSQNPYRLEQSSDEDVSAEQLDIDPFSKSIGPSIWQKIKDRLLPEKEGVSPTRQKAMVIMVPILFVVMIFVLRQVLSKAPQETEGAMNDDAPLVANADSNNEIDWQIPEPMPVVMRDPIKLSSQSNFNNNGQIGISDGMGTAIFSVRGILYSDDKPSAVIGNRIVHLNEKINEATIVKIDKDYVVFERDGKRWTKKVAEIDLELKQGENEQEVWEQTEQEKETNDMQDLEENL
jgi:hypothetical protein